MDLQLPLRDQIDLDSFMSRHRDVIVNVVEVVATYGEEFSICCLETESVVVLSSIHAKPKKARRRPPVTLLQLTFHSSDSVNSEKKTQQSVRRPRHPRIAWTSDETVLP